jgi:uncharacterized protein YcbX
MRVSIMYLDARVGGTIERVSTDQREFVIAADDGTTVTARLNAATARFMVDGLPGGARIRFEAR